MDSLALSLNQILTFLSSMIIALISFIYFVRYKLQSRQKKLINKNSSNWTRLSERTKCHSLDVNRYRRSFFWTGMTISLAFIISVFSWVQYDPVSQVLDYPWTEVDIVDIDPPQIFPEKKLPPPPTVIEEIPANEMLEEDAPEFIDMSIEETGIIDKNPIKERVPAPKDPILPGPEIYEPDPIVLFAEQQPRFPGCEDMEGSNKEKQKCALQKLLAFIYENIKYPSIASENGIEGTCVVRFIVERDGSVQGITNLKDIGAGCGDEAMRVVRLMNDLSKKWTPGIQRGKAVRVQYNLPIRFKLEK